MLFRRAPSARCVDNCPEMRQPINAGTTSTQTGKPPTFSGAFVRRPAPNFRKTDLGLPVVSGLPWLTDGLRFWARPFRLATGLP